MNKSLFKTIQENENRYKIKYKLFKYTGFILGLNLLFIFFSATFKISIPILTVTSWALFIVSPVYIFFYSLIIKPYIEYKFILKHEVISINIGEYSKKLYNYFEDNNYKVKQYDRYYRAKRSNMHYKVFNFNELTLEEFKKGYTKKFSIDYIAIYVIISNTFNEDMIDFFKYEGNYLFEKRKIIITGVELDCNKIYMNYGSISKNDLKFLYEM